MKINVVRAGLWSVLAGSFLGLTGCVVYPSGRVGIAPVVVVRPRPVYVAPAPVYAAPPPPPPATVYVAPPAPAPEVEVVEVPDGYVWDGYEYVGVVGDRYYYLGPGNIWLLAEPWRLERFHGWERYHGDWRGHVIRNERFRRDARGREHAWHDEHRR